MSNPMHNVEQSGTAPWLRRLVAIAVSVLAAGLGYVVLSLPQQAAGLSQIVQAQLHLSGVTNPVTAVLLNFRGYDTLLEMIVLLLALLGVWTSGEMTTQAEEATGAVLDAMVRLLVPLLNLVAAYLLWVGAHAPGGAFQAGAVLGAAGVLLLLTGRRPYLALPPWLWRLVLIAGPMMFVLIAIITAVLTSHLLQLPPGHAGLIILALETAATLSIAVTLTALFLGGEPPYQEYQ
ncbi:MAG: Na(+)/H(+) antiporter subunit B [Gammaproteobacteria bacterium]